MSIYPDKKDGKLTGRFAVEVQKEGRRLRGRANSFKEAQELEATLSKRLADGDGLGEIGSRKFSAQGSKPRTLGEAIKRAKGRLWSGKAYEDTSFKHLAIIEGIVGSDKPLDAVSTETIDDLIDSLQGQRQIADATVNRYLSALHKFLGWCVEREYRTIPLPTFAWRDEDEGRIRWITPDEEDTLYKKLRGVISLVVYPAIQTGMRRGELLSLEEDQITKGWVHLWDTKTSTPRSVPIDDRTYDTLRWLVQNDQMPNPAKLRYEWDLARGSMGLTNDPWFVFHACRHTCATRLVQANVNLKVVQEFMGHKRIETTLRYAHINNTMLTDALRTMQTFHTRNTSPSGVDTNDRFDDPTLVRYRRHATLLRGSKQPTDTFGRPAGVAKLVDAPDLGSGIDPKLEAAFDTESDPE